MQITPNFIAMGAEYVILLFIVYIILTVHHSKEGRHGLWLDFNFENGTSETCGTYFNR